MRGVVSACVLALSAWPALGLQWPSDTGALRGALSARLPNSTVATTTNATVSSSPNATTPHNTTATNNSTTTVVHAPPNLVSGFKAAEGIGLFPQNVKYAGNNTITMTIRPGMEATRIFTTQSFKHGRVAFRCNTASVMSGVVTSLYLASGQGRKSDTELGQQDEIDMEWKGLEPTQLQTNLFLDGQEQMKVDDLGFHSSDVTADYAVEWTDQQVQFFVNHQVIRTLWLPRPLKPMHLEISVWTTHNGWPGLLQWAGVADWASRDYKPVTATFQILSLPAVDDMHPDQEQQGVAVSNREQQP